MINKIFYRGLKKAYSPVLHRDKLYFSTDTCELLVNDKSYGGGGIQDVKIEDGIITLQFINGEEIQVSINEATETANGLMSKLDKIKLDSYPEFSEIQSSLDSKISKDQIGQPNGITPLNDEGLISSSYLPSSVYNVIKVDNLDFEGESEKIYVYNNLIYYWNGTEFIEISKSLELGETSSTAYPGDKGKLNSDDIQYIKENYIEKIPDSTDILLASGTPIEMNKFIGNIVYEESTGTLYFQTPLETEESLVASNVIVPTVTSSNDGLMTSEDLEKLNEIDIEEIW